jgi:MFS family permease
VHELRVEHPLVDLRLLRHRAVLTANVTGLLIGVTMYMTVVTVTQLVQLQTFGFGAGIFVAGLTLVPLSVLSSGVSRTLPWLEGRVGIRPIIPAGAVAVAAASLFFAVTASSLWQAFVTMGLIGVGLGTTFAALPGLIVGAAPHDRTGSAMGLYQVARFVGFAMGSGLAITLLRAFGEHGQPTLGAYRATAFVGAGIALLTATVAWLLPGRTETIRSDELDAYEVQEGRLAAAGLEDLTEPPAQIAAPSAR